MAHKFIIAKAADACRYGQVKKGFALLDHIGDSL